MYQLVNKDNETIAVRKTEGAFVKVIPFDPSNTDYQKFKNDIQGLSKDFDGNFIVASELQDADGNVMSAEEAKAYIATLP